MIPKKMWEKISLLCFSVLICGRASSQGPLVSYYYQQATELQFGKCCIYFEGGSEQRIPFLPVITRGCQRSPLGTRNYQQDIKVRGQLAFAGVGIVLNNETRNDYCGRRGDYTTGEIDVSNKIVLFSIEYSDSLKEKYKKLVSLEHRIAEAERRGAEAVVLFSRKDDFPFLYAQYDSVGKIPHIPVITIMKSSFEKIMASAGEDGQSMLGEWENNAIPTSRVLISRLSLQLKGCFNRVESEHFLFCFREKTIPETQMKELVQINEKAVRFIFDFFSSIEKPRWDKKMNVYFRDFDSKVFYTHHWGVGLASKEGVFMVHYGKIPDFGLAVHENTHLYTYANWGEEASSFMAEGIAKHLEALSGDKNRNHLAVLHFMGNNELFPLEELITYHLGMSGLKTTVGYPATGSFTGFLIDSYGLEKFKCAYILEGRGQEEKENKGTWMRVYEKPLETLESEWLYWLVRRFNGDEKMLKSHFKHIETLRKMKKEMEAQKPKPETFPLYEGVYIWKSMGREFSIQIEKGKLLMKVQGAPDMTAQLVPAELHGFCLNGGPASGQIMKFHLDDKGKVIKASMGKFEFIRK